MNHDSFHVNLKNEEHFFSFIFYAFVKCYWFVAVGLLQPNSISEHFINWIIKLNFMKL